MSDNSLIQGYLSLSQDVNKTKNGIDVETAEGAIGELTPELELSMTTPVKVEDGIMDSMQAPKGETEVKPKPRRRTEPDANTE